MNTRTSVIIFFIISVSFGIAEYVFPDLFWRTYIYGFMSAAFSNSTPALNMLLARELQNIALSVVIYFGMIQILRIKQK